MGKIRTFVQAAQNAAFDFWEGLQTTFSGIKTSIWIPKTTDTNANAAIKPKGNGANVAQDPDGTTTGGNARGEYATDWQKIRGSNQDVASGNNSTIGGGFTNRASGNNSTVGGGQNNRATNVYSTVGGGYLNQATAIRSVIAGGSANTASEQYSTVGGGRSNVASGSDSTVSGGDTNTASGLISTVSGGDVNTASGSRATVSGGRSNTAGGARATISGGQDNTASGQRSVVGGGESNDVSSQYGTISGGQGNTASTNTHATVGGGESNTASGLRSTISGGFQNTASNSYSTVGGGFTNTASGEQSTVGGGDNNTASGNYSFAAGENNTASGSSSFVTGANNTASGSRSSVGAGRFSQARADYSFVAGFRANTSVSAPNSVCIGENGDARYRSAFVHSSGTFTGADNGAAQSIQLISRSQADLTTGATTTLHLDGSSLNFEFSSNNAAANILAEWVAVVDSISGTATGVSVGDVIAQDDLFLMKEVANTASIVGGVTNTATKNDASQATASMGYSINAGNELVITFTAPTFSGGGTLTYRIVHRMLLVEVIF